MNIAVLDFGMAKTHVRLNISNFKVLKEIGHLYIVNSLDYYDELRNEKNVTLFDTRIAEKEIPSNVLLSRLSIINNMAINSMIFNEFSKVRFDGIIIMGFEVITLSLLGFFIPRGIPVYIFQHQQLDELENPIKRFFFNTYKNKMNHIVYEESYRDYMKNRMKVKRVHTIHYIKYVSDSERRFCDYKKNNKKLIVGLSSNNDDAVIESIISYQKRTRFADKANVFMYIRSKNLTYEDEALKVGYEYLPPEKYDELFSDATCVLSLVPSNFHRRLSGPTLDAITMGKRTICSNKTVFETFSEKVPSLIKHFENPNDLEDIINDSEWPIDENEIRDFIRIHTPEYVLDEYKKMLIAKKDE